MSTALKNELYRQDPSGQAKVFWFSEAELKELLAECLEEANYDHERALQAHYDQGYDDGYEVGKDNYGCCEDCA